MGSSDVDTVCLLNSSYPDCSDGKSHEGNEGHGRYEGDEGHEEEVSEQDCKGPHGQSPGAPRIQGEDCRWLDRRIFDKNKHGRVVSKKQSARGKKNPWMIAVQKARKALKIKGFCAVKKGSELYKKAKEFQQ